MWLVRKRSRIARQEWFACHENFSFQLSSVDSSETKVIDVCRNQNEDCCQVEYSADRPVPSRNRPKVNHGGCWSDCPRLLIVSGFIAHSCKAALAATIQARFRNDRIPFGAHRADPFSPTRFRMRPNGVAKRSKKGMLVVIGCLSSHLGNTSLRLQRTSRGEARFRR